MNKSLKVTKSQYSNKTAYYVNANNVVFDFTDGNINIYNR